MSPRSTNKYMSCGLVVTSAVMLFGANPAWAQSPKYTVALVVITVDDELRPALKSALEHEIRSPREVALVDKDPMFIVRVLARQTRARPSSQYRLILAYNFATVYQDDLTDTFDLKKISPEAARAVGQVVKTLEQYQGSGVVTTSLSDAYRACASVAGAFKSAVIDYNRQAVREVHGAHVPSGK